MGADGGLWVAPRVDESSVRTVDLRRDLPFCFSASLLPDVQAPVSVDVVVDDAGSDLDDINSDNNLSGSDLDSAGSDVSDFEPAVDEDEN